MKVDKLSQLEIKFETADILPPPFSHQILLTLDFKENFIDTKFEIAYTYRDELSDEEILEEGFTGNEDLAWAGELSKAWEAPILNLLSKTPEKFNTKALEEEQNFLEITINQKAKGNIINHDAWEYLLQELTQAVYETYGKEAPFKLIFKKIEKDKSTSTFELNLHYTNRTVEASTSVADVINHKKISWEEASDLLQHIFIGDFITDKASKAEPKTAGKFLSIGDGFWYEFTKSLKNPNGNKAYIINLYERFEEYL